MLFSDADSIIRMVACLGAIGQVIAGGQVIGNARLFLPGGVLEWQHVRIKYSTLQRCPTVRSARPRLSVAIALGMAKGLAGVAVLLAALTERSLLAPVVGLLAADFAVGIRAPLGEAAADSMGRIIFVALGIALATHSPRIISSSLIFIAAQSLTAYLVSGLAKARFRGWYDGSFLRELLSTRSFGRKNVYELFRRQPALSRTAGWLVVAGECLFPIVLLLPLQWTLTALSAGLIFHLTVAMIMGFNTFLWAFVATYPAVLFVHHLIHS